MIFINPLVYYGSISSPNFDNDGEESKGCLGAACGFIASVIIFASLLYLCLTLTESILQPILIAVDSVIIFPIMVICLTILTIRIENKINNRKKFNNNESKI